MKKYGKNGRIYSLDDLHRLINLTARNRLGMSGQEAINIIMNKNWEKRKHHDVWLWLSGLVSLLSTKLPQQKAKDVNIQQKS